MITLENKINTVVFHSEPSTVFTSGSLSKINSKIMLYNDGQGVLVESSGFRFTVKIEYLNPDFIATHNLTDDKSLFDLLVNWQNS